jgi:hypothetical protein
MKGEGEKLNKRRRGHTAKKRRTHGREEEENRGSSPGMITL